MDRNTFKHARFANEVTSTTARGSPFTGYALNKVVWAGELVDAAKSSMYFLDAVNVKQLAQGEKSIVIPYRKYFVKALQLISTILNLQHQICLKFGDKPLLTELLIKAFSLLQQAAL